MVKQTALNVLLTPELLAFCESQTGYGRRGSTSEVAQTSFRLLGGRGMRSALPLLIAALMRMEPDAR